MHKHKKKIRVAKKFLIGFIAFCLGLYLLLGISMFLFQDVFLYHPSSLSFYECDKFNNYTREEFNGTRFYFKEFSHNKDRVIVYYSGNSGRACDRGPLTRGYEGYQASVLFVEYAGYGGDDKKPSQELLLQDAQNIATFIQQKNFSEVVVVGESLGTSVASYQAFISDVDILLLIAPFYSTKSLGEERFPYYPLSFLEVENYDTRFWLENYTGKLVILHGRFDPSIPISQALQLYEEVPTENKYMFALTFARHNDVYNYFDTYRVIRFAILDRYSLPLDTIRIED